MSVMLETTEGDLVIDLDTHNSPKACTNFLKLCKTKYYNFAPFFNVHRDFTAQCGDPNYPRGDNNSCQSVWGGTFTPEEDYTGLVKGDMALALSGGQAGSQFVVVLGDVKDALHDKVARFGHVVEGEDTLDRINVAYCDESHRPYKDIRIKHAYILDDPFDDPPGVSDDIASPEPTELQLSTVRLGENDGQDGDDDDDNNEEAEEERMKRNRSQQTRSEALTLEMLGDLPFAEVKPQENVLFVCKLNPVTNSDDLNLIFARFGPIVSCEVVRDQSTGDSLQYAFIEFENKQDCERAYFKMDGVLIDDRRIHVDFSQSVSKLANQWRNKQNTQRQRAHGGRYNSTSSGSRRRDDYGRSHRSSRRDYDRKSRDYKDKDSRHRSRRSDRERDEYRSSSGRERDRDREKSRRDRDRDGYKRRDRHGSKSSHRPRSKSPRR